MTVGEWPRWGVAPLGSHDSARGLLRPLWPDRTDIPPPAADWPKWEPSGGQVGAKWEPSGMALAQVGGACRYKEALALYYRALQISESSYGSEHPDVAERGHRSPDRPLLPHNAHATRASMRTHTAHAARSRLMAHVTC